jgi:hypothetical protein
MMSCDLLQSIRELHPGWVNVNLGHARQDVSAYLVGHPFADACFEE